MNIQVTQEHIANGEQNSCVACPVALAIREHVGEGVIIFVSDTTVQLVRYPKRTRKKRLAKAATAFIRNFDTNDLTVGPFEFEFHIPSDFRKKV